MEGSKQPCRSHKSAALQHSHKKRKDSLETRVLLFVFLLELEISGKHMSYRKYIKTVKKVFAVRIFFFLFSFSVFIASAKASKAIVKISTEEKDYRKCFLCILVWIATAYQ